MSDQITRADFSYSGMKAIGFGVVAIMVMALSAPDCFAQHPDWDGPGCQTGNQTLPLCSTEPPSSIDPYQCYLGHSQDYTPDPIQLDLIAICQAAKHAADAPATRRPDDLTRVVGLIARINPDIQEYPQRALANGDAIQKIGTEAERLGPI
jgi:hypothetical protein